ncbi:energy transducer TonB [Burkholderiaceae bacterium DAT-1]|nr:energy transducer TonB [Burkholderiaceae bacterium DAT-1]
MKHALIASALLLALGAEAQASYSVKHNSAVTGSNVTKHFALSDIPFDGQFKVWDQQAQSNLLQKYPGTHADFTPPLPVDSFRVPLQELDSQLQSAALDVTGRLRIRYSVNASGQTERVELLDAPTQETAAFALKTLSKIKFTPAKCGSDACASFYELDVELR